MIEPSSSSRPGFAAAPRFLKRAARFSGGVFVGAIVSTLSGYMLMSALYPTASAPNSQAALAAVAPTGLTAAEAVVRHPAPPAVSPATPGNAVVATFAPADVAMPRPPMRAPDATETVARRPASVAPRPLERDIAIAPQSAIETASLRPTPRPQTHLPVETMVATAPARSALRPQPRPEGLVLAVARLLDRAPAAIPSTRPQPRPEVIRVAATLSATATEAAPSVQTARPAGLFPSRKGNECSRDHTRAIPSRPSGAPGGSQFLANLGGLSGSERDARVIAELARGNVPAFLRELEAVTFRGKDSRGADTEIVVCVTPDYLALGSDRDFVRVPLGLPAAARIANAFGMTLPTPRMVDAIYAQADVKLAPAPMTPGPQMSSTSYLLRHNATIEGQLHGRRGLIAGQKKDVVMASRMASNPGRVAIYGWHRTSGRPIQPVSTVHGANYADYSHGIRLVSKTAYLNGRAVALDELLASQRYASLLNKEGPLPGRVIRIASR